MLASKTYAISNGFDYAMSIKMLCHTSGIKTPLYVFTHAESIFDTITASKKLCELHLTNEILEIRCTYKANKIDNVAWICSEQNIADDQTRLLENGILLNTLQSGTLHFIIGQRDCREEDHSTSKMIENKKMCFYWPGLNICSGKMSEIFAGDFFYYLIPLGICNIFYSSFLYFYNYL